MTAALEGGEWSAARTGRTLSPGKTRYPFYRRLGGLQDRSGRVVNLVPTGVRSRTVQPVAQSLFRLSYPVPHIDYIKQSRYRSGGSQRVLRMLKFPDFVTTAQDGGKVVSLTHLPPLPPGNAPGTHFC